MNPKAEILYRLGEPFAAGMFEDENADVVERHGRGLRRYFEHAPPPPEVGRLYPAGAQNLFQLAGRYVRFHYSHTLDLDADGLRALGDARLASSFEKTLLRAAVDELRYWTTNLVPPRYAIGGSGWTHSVLNYPRLLSEGLDGVRARAEAQPESPLRRATLDVLAGLDHFLDRAPGSIAGDVRRPARDFYSALRGFGFFHALDQYDSAGRFNEILGPYYHGEPDAADWLAALFRTVDLQNGWHYLFTGRFPDFTRLCLSALKWRRPNAGFLVSADTSDALWDAVFDQWAAGQPSPSLYNEAVYRDALAGHPEQQDTFCFGGCTELMFGGTSNVGSIDAGVNLLDIYAASSPERFDDDVRRHIAAAAAGVRRNAEFAARYRPQLLRTLFIDDCLARNREYHDGGARHYASVVNVAGLTDLANALAAADGSRERFGNDQAAVDRLAAAWAERVFGWIREETGRGGGSCYPAVILFATYAQHGAYVPATPDGRAAGAPLADSAGAATGTDRRGPTALLNSVSRLPSRAGLGTMILNLRLPRGVAAGDSRRKLRALVAGFFAQGGMQLQVTTVDRAALADALENPDAHPELVVRIGGYSEYFQRLSPELRREVVLRTEHDL